MKNYQEHLTEIGRRIKQYRISTGLTQKDLALKSGVSESSIARLEQGASVQTDSLIKILIALRLDENIEMLIPDQTKRPSYYLNSEKEKMRFRKKTKVPNNTGFVWGDEK